MDGDNRDPQKKSRALHITRCDFVSTQDYATDALDTRLSRAQGRRGPEIGQDLLMILGLRSVRRCRNAKYVSKMIGAFLSHLLVNNIWASDRAL
jgi:hypothetical protein